MPRTFLIDTDTASDDAVAIIMALRAPDVRVAAITTVAGNVNVVQSTSNALYTVELCGADAKTAITLPVAENAVGAVTAARKTKQANSSNPANAPP